MADEPKPDEPSDFWKTVISMLSGGVLFKNRAWAKIASDMTMSRKKKVAILTLGAVFDFAIIAVAIYAVTHITCVCEVCVRSVLDNVNLSVPIRPFNLTPSFNLTP